MRTGGFAGVIHHRDFVICYSFVGVADLNIYKTKRRAGDDRAAMQQYSNTVISNTAIQQYSNTAIQQYSNTAIQQYSNTAIQQYSNTAIQQYSNTADH